MACLWLMNHEFHLHPRSLNISPAKLLDPNRKGVSFNHYFSGVNSLLNFEVGYLESSGSTPYTTNGKYMDLQPFQACFCSKVWDKFGKQRIYHILFHNIISMLYPISYYFNLQYHIVLKHMALFMNVLFAVYRMVAMCSNVYLLRDVFLTHFNSWAKLCNIATKSYGTR